MLMSANLMRSRDEKVCFLKLDIDVYLRAKCEVSGIILTGFRQWVGGILSPSPPQNEPVKRIFRFWLKVLGSFDMQTKELLTFSNVPEVCTASIF